MYLSSDVAGYLIASYIYLCSVLFIYTYFSLYLFSHCMYYNLYSLTYILFFFFQAEDGIRDIGVTGVQTCALPISLDAAADRPAAGRPHPARDRPAAARGGVRQRPQRPPGRRPRRRRCGAPHPGPRRAGPPAACEPDRRTRTALRVTARLHAAIGQVELAIGADGDRGLLTLVDGADRRPWWGTPAAAWRTEMGAPLVSLTLSGGGPAALLGWR